MGWGRIFLLSLGYLAPIWLLQVALWNKSASWWWCIALKSSHQYNRKISFVWVQMQTHPQLLRVKGTAVTEKWTSLHLLFRPAFELPHSSFGGYFCYLLQILNSLWLYMWSGRKCRGFIRLFLPQSFHFRWYVNPTEVSDKTTRFIARAGLFLTIIFTSEGNFE